MEAAFITQTGTLSLRNAQGQECLIAHTPVNSTEDWALVAYILMDELGRAEVDWVLIGVISAGLLLLLIVDLTVMLRLNRKLRLAAQEARSANQAKTDFLSTMSHDIRTPMNAIIGLTTLAEKSVRDTETVRDYLRKIGLAGNHLLTLINDILDISKVESGMLSLSPVSFSIVETAENLVNISRPMVTEKNIDFRFRARHMDRELLYADQLRLNQIFIKAIPHNSGAQIAQSDFSADWPKNAGNTWRITEDFWAICRNNMQARCVP